MLNSIKAELKGYKKTIEAILSEPADENDNMSRKVSVAGIKIYNGIAERFNSQKYGFEMHCFREDMIPGTSLYPKTAELLGQVETALQILEVRGADGPLKGQFTEAFLDTKNRTKKIFISHSSNDIEYVKAVIELLEDLGLRSGEIFCSSFPEYGIPAGKDIYSYLREQFNIIDLSVFFLLSDDYYKSPVCLNEMGASWVLAKESLSILLPGFPVEKMKGVVNRNAIAVRLDEEKAQLVPRLNGLKELIEQKFDREPLSMSVWERKRDQFIDKITVQNEPKPQPKKDRVYRRRIVQTDRLEKHTFYLLDEKLPLEELGAVGYVEGETHWLADWYDKNAVMFQGKSEVTFQITSVDEPSDYNHNGVRIKNARTIKAKIIKVE